MEIGVGMSNRKTPSNSLVEQELIVNFCSSLLGDDSTYLMQVGRIELSRIGGFEPSQRTDKCRQLVAQKVETPYLHFYAYAHQFVSLLLLFSVKQNEHKTQVLYCTLRTVFSATVIYLYCNKIISVRTG